MAGYGSDDGTTNNGFGRRGQQRLRPTLPAPVGGPAAVRGGPTPAFAKLQSFFIKFCLILNFPLNSPLRTWAFPH
jgi:hypothetical protein